MLYIWGRNNGHLIRNNHKSTFSLPQKLTLTKPVAKCACGYDFITIITPKGELYFLYQGGSYQIPGLPLLRDIATSDNLIVGITLDGKTLVWQFVAEKVMKGDISITQITTVERIANVFMGFGDIFLLSDKLESFHFRRNQWYETKTFSNPQKVNLSKRIVQIAAGEKNNLFLTYEGTAFFSKKNDPTNPHLVNTEEKFLYVAAWDYEGGITKSGSIMIWGQTPQGNYATPQLFSKLVKKFTMITLGKENGYAISDDGEVWIWGKNANGELGVSDYQPRYQPFPLITLEKQKIINLYIGNSYACCLCQIGVSKKIKNKRNSYFPTPSTPVNINDSSKLPFHQLNTPQPIPLKKHQLNRVENSRVPSRASSRQDSIKRSKTILSKQAKLLTPKIPKHQKQNRQSKQSKLFMEKNKQFIAYDQNNQSTTIKQLKMQNKMLKSNLKQNQLILKDLTNKMRILEDAIDQHQRTLTKRDSILEQFQRRQIQYKVHIQQLEKSINYIAQGNSDYTTNMAQLNNDLNNSLERQRIYFSQKIKKYQQAFQDERIRYKERIRQLEDQLVHYRQLVYIPTQQDLGTDRSFLNVQRTIQKIEQNKNYISKSANKLIELLDMSPS